MKYRMLIEDVLQLRSTDGIGLASVASVMEDTCIDSDYYVCVREEMRLAGINLVPVYVFNDTFRNGHHRVKIALSLGHEEVIVTDVREESGFTEKEERTVVKYTGKERLPQ